MSMNGAKIVENIFFTVTCVSVFTCVIRSDYNFAMGLLSYYMIKNIGQKQGSEISKVARTVSQTAPHPRPAARFFEKRQLRQPCHNG